MAKETKVSGEATVSVGDGRQYFNRSVYRKGVDLYMKIRVNKAGRSYTEKISVGRTGVDSFIVLDHDAWARAYNSHK